MFKFQAHFKLTIQKLTPFLTAVDETSSFLSRTPYEKICHFVDCIVDNLINREACFYDKLMIFGFGGVKSGLQFGKFLQWIHYFQSN